MATAQDKLFFNTVLSFGSFCLTAGALQKGGFRQFATPLDWIFSSADMISHCLSDDWNSFMDPSQYIERNTDPNAKSNAGHIVYSSMIKKPRIFIHRSPLIRSEFDYYRRCVSRIRDVAHDASAVSLLVLLQSSRHRSRHEKWVRQFHNLFELLQSGIWKGRFELLVIRLQRRRVEDTDAHEVEFVSSENGKCVLRVVYLPIWGQNGAEFDDIRDQEAFSRLVSGDRSFQLRTPEIRRKGDLTKQDFSDGKVNG
jgi:hypothetical protein